MTWFSLCPFNKSIWFGKTQVASHKKPWQSAQLTSGGLKQSHCCKQWKRKRPVLPTWWLGIKHRGRLVGWLVGWYEKIIRFGFSSTSLHTHPKVATPTPPLATQGHLQCYHQRLRQSIGMATCHSPFWPNVKAGWLKNPCRDAGPEVDLFFFSMVSEWRRHSWLIFKLALMKWQRPNCKVNTEVGWCNTAMKLKTNMSWLFAELEAHELLTLFFWLMDQHVEIGVWQQEGLISVLWGFTFSPNHGSVTFLKRLLNDEFYHSLLG